MRRLIVALGILALGILAAAGAQAKPTTIYVGAPHNPSVLYGPADMLCDLNTCRLFNLPKDLGLASNAIVEFGLPQMSGQDRVDVRRCFQICRASVLGFMSDKATAADRANPTISITPIEMRLE